MAYVYILQSLKNGQYYIGFSRNPNKRLLEHNAGQVKATRYKRPWKLVFCQKFTSSQQARKIEYKLKKLKRHDYLDKIIKNGIIKLNLNLENG